MQTDTRIPLAYHERVPRLRPPGEPDVDLVELLHGLGDTPEAVAATLDAEDCRGPQQNDCFCPVATYLAKRTGRAASATASVSALGDFTRDADGRIETFMARQWARTPRPVAEMILRYDDGDFRFLSDKPSPSEREAS